MSGKLLSEHRQLLPGQLADRVGGLAGVTKGPFGINQDVEPEDRLQRVVHFGWLTADEPAELRIGEERAVQLERPIPALRCQWLPVSRDRHLRLP